MEGISYSVHYHRVPPQCVRVKRQFLVPGCELIWKQHECNELSQNEAILE